MGEKKETKVPGESSTEMTIPLKAGNLEQRY